MFTQLLCRTKHFFKMTQSIKQVTVEGIDAQTIFDKFDKLERLLIEAAIVRSDVSNREKLLTREQVKELLDISLPTLHSWTNRGMLQAHRIGNCVRYKEHEVLAALVPIRQRTYKKLNPQPLTQSYNNQKNISK